MGFGNSFLIKKREEEGKKREGERERKIGTLSSLIKKNKEKKRKKVRRSSLKNERKKFNPSIKRS